MLNLNRTILSMAGLRIFSSLLEAIAALLMLHFNDIRIALRVNAALGAVGPAILLLVGAVGLYGGAEQLSLGRITLILLGIGLILYATR